MKKIFVVVASLMLVAAPAANAQAFLNKLKEKAEKAIGNAVSEKIGGKVNEVVSDKLGVDMSQMESDDSDSGDGNMAAPDKQLERRRTSTFAWNEEVTPSTAKFPIPLLNELPKVPSAAELANPSESAMIAYYRAIKRVTLRAEELNADETCGDEFAQQWREKTANEMAASFGMTRAEFDRFCDENTPEDEREKLGEKMMAAMFGGVDMNALSKMEGQEAPSEKSIENAAMAAAMKVYQENPAETKYVTGKTPAELQALMAKNPKSYEAELNAYSDAMFAKDGEAYKKRHAAFQSKLSAAATQAVSSAAGIGDIMKLTQNSGKMMSGMQDLMKYQQAMQKLAKAQLDMAKTISMDTNVDAEFSAAEARKLESLKKQIYATDDPKVYNPLYAQALESIKSYRLRAAGVWSAAVQKQFDAIKAKVPAFIKTIREEVEAGYLPECALYRSPLNVVIEAGDLLEDAYSEFPSNYPSMFEDEPVVEDENLFWPEFQVGASISDMLDKYLYKNQGGTTYRYNGGNWTPVSANFDYNNLPEIKQPVSASWKSSDGKREVIFNADGCWLQLPEGDVVYPSALEKVGNKLQWLVTETIQRKDGTYVQRVSKCTYKL